MIDNLCSTFLKISILDTEGDLGSDDSSNLTAFGEVGLNFRLVRNVVAAPSYRLLWIDTDNELFEDTIAHIFKMGLRISF